MKLSFHGGAQEVTGACHLLETATTKILVDCGLFQGCEECADMNFGKFGFDPGAIDALFITHTHLDHVGRIPRLVREGFRGVIYSTAATRDIARFILEDALSLARRDRDERELYNEQDIEKAFSLWKALPYRERLEVGDMEMQLRNAGHVLGSAMIEIWAEGKHILFTGDLGNVPSTLLPPPEMVEGVEYLVMESTYGNKTHEEAGTRELLLERAVEDIAARRGTLMIPAFATERTQDILHLLNEMVHEKRIPDMPMFIDSPLAIKITEVYERYLSEYNEDIQELAKKHPNLFRFKRLMFTPSVEESRHINDISQPKVIIAGSGMMSGGRILHHARRYLGDAKSILLIIGYQSAGSLGRRLIDGQKTIKIFGDEIFVEAEIRKIGGFSAHADNPQLYAFVAAMHSTLRRVFMVQGEQAAAHHLAEEIRDRLAIDASVPLLHDEVEL